MTWNSVLGLVSLIALSIPIFFILALRLGRYKTFPALLFYYLTVFTYNLFKQGYLQTNAVTESNWNICNNLLDAPIMIMFLTYCSTSPRFAKKMKITIGLFIAFEITVIALTGFNNRAITIILGPGLLLVFAF